MRLDEVRHLLPEQMQIIVKLIGLPLAVRLVHELGGTTFPVSKNQTRLGEIRHAMLAEAIGVTAADVLTRHFGGASLYIANCHAAMLQLRNRKIISDFDALSVDLGANGAVAKLARDNHLSDRRIWEILKTTDPTPGGQQADLFHNE